MQRGPPTQSTHSERKGPPSNQNPTERYGKPILPGGQTSTSREAKNFHSSLISGGMNSKDALRQTRQNYPDFMKEVILEPEESTKQKGVSLRLLLFSIIILVGGVSTYMFIDIPFF